VTRPPAKARPSSPKEIQNPIADLISFPFQNNTNFNYGPLKGTQDILNIQPVIPIHLSEDWNLITRTIFPLIWQPQLAPNTGRTFGLGDVNLSLFLSPKQPSHGIIWGIGPVIVPPTATSSKVGSNIWGAGPTAVALRMDGSWVYGALVNNLWSFSGTSGPGGVSNAYNSFLLQPFVNYNFGEGWYVTSSPIVTANWLAPAGQQWTVPVGGGGGARNQTVRHAADQPLFERLLQLRSPELDRTELAIAQPAHVYLLRRQYER